MLQYHVVPFGISVGKEFALHIDVGDGNPAFPHALARCEPHALNRCGESQFEPRYIGVESKVGIETFSNITVVLVVKSYVSDLSTVDNDRGAFVHRLAVVIGRAEPRSVYRLSRADYRKPFRGVLKFHALFQNSASVGVDALYFQYRVGGKRQVGEVGRPCHRRWGQPLGTVSVINIPGVGFSLPESRSHFFPEVGYR